VEFACDLPGKLVTANTQKSRMSESAFGCPFNESMLRRGPFDYSARPTTGRCRTWTKVIAGTQLTEISVPGDCHAGSLLAVSESAEVEWADELEQLDEQRVVLSEAIGTASRCFDYIYDFGDNWHHVVIVEDPYAGHSNRDCTFDASRVKTCLVIFVVRSMATIELDRQLLVVPEMDKYEHDEIRTSSLSNSDS
jgi:hypothetical protein